MSVDTTDCPLLRTRKNKRKPRDEIVVKVPGVEIHLPASSKTASVIVCVIATAISLVVITIAFVIFTLATPESLSSFSEWVGRKPETAPATRTHEVSFIGEEQITVDPPTSMTNKLSEPLLR